MLVFAVPLGVDLELFLVVPPGWGGQQTVLIPFPLPELPSAVGAIPAHLDGVVLAVGSESWTVGSGSRPVPANPQPSGRALLTRLMLVLPLPVLLPN
jgi:hypothetical protein